MRKQAVLLYQYYGRVVSDASMHTARFVKSHATGEVLFVLAATAGLLLVQGRPDKGKDWLLLFIPFMGVVAVVALVGVGNLVLSPFRLDSELQQRLQRFATRAVDIVPMGWPVAHGSMLLIPLQIANTDDDRAIDIDVFCFIEKPGEHPTMLQLETDPVPGVEVALTSQQRAEGQLAIPLRIGAQSRRVGYLVYQLHQGMSFDNDDRVTLQISDGVNHTILIDEEEVWPSIWRDLQYVD